VCCSVERVYVEASVAAEFERKVVALAYQWQVGPGHDPQSKVGPMVSGTQRDLVAAQVAAAVTSGARMAFQSSIPPCPAAAAPDEPSTAVAAPAATSSSSFASASNWFPVTVLADLQQSMAIQRNETFGPVIALATFHGAWYIHRHWGERCGEDMGLWMHLFSSAQRKSQKHTEALLI